MKYTKFYDYFYPNGRLLLADEKTGEAWFLGNDPAIFDGKRFVKNSVGMDWKERALKSIPALKKLGTAPASLREMYHYQHPAGKVTDDHSFKELELIGTTVVIRRSLHGPYGHEEHIECSDAEQAAKVLEAQRPSGMTAIPTWHLPKVGVLTRYFVRVPGTGDHEKASLQRCDDWIELSGAAGEFEKRFKDADLQFEATLADLRNKGYILLKLSVNDTLVPKAFSTPKPAPMKPQKLPKGVTIPLLAQVDPKKLAAYLEEHPESLFAGLKGTIKPAWLGELNGLSVDDLEEVLSGLSTILTGKPKSLRVPALNASKPVLHHGDLHVASSLQVTSALVVTGNLTVDGFLMDGGPDSAVAIGGKFKVGNLYTHGSLAVSHELEASGVVYGYHNDHSLSAGRIRAPLVISDDHDIRASVKAKLYLESDSYEGNEPALIKMVVPEVVKDGGLDRQLFIQRLLSGAPLLRGK